jgi:hypothetical protein
MNWVGGAVLGIVAATVMILWESRSTPKRIVAGLLGTIAGLVTVVVIADDIDGRSRLDWAVTILVLAVMYLYHRVEKLTKSLKVSQNDIADLKRQLTAKR